MRNMRIWNAECGVRSDPGSPCSSNSAIRNPQSRFPLAVVTLLCVLGLIGCQDSDHLPGTENPAAPTTNQTVTLAILHDDNRTELGDLAWAEEMTVLDAMEQAREEETLSFTSHGEGAETLITEINEVDNEGGGGRNWMFYVNDRLADRSCAVLELEPGDAILWGIPRVLVR